MLNYADLGARLLGVCPLHEPRGQNIEGLEPVEPREVGAYISLFIFGQIVCPD